MSAQTESGSADFAAAVSHSRPFWSPSGDRIGFLRTDEGERFGSVAELGVYHLADETARLVTCAGSQELDAPYFHWIASDALLVEFTHRANRGLYRLSFEDEQRGEAIQGLEIGRALWRHGTPHEVVIYPGAGHGLREPELLVDPMRRNLAWFQRWIPANPGTERTGQ